MYLVGQNHAAEKSVASDHLSLPSNLNGAMEPSTASLIQNLVPAHLPPVFRLQKLETAATSGNRLVTTIGVLFHERATMRVTWTSRLQDRRLQRGSLVSIGWKGVKPHCQEGAVRISRLVPISRPVPSVNLFDTVPPSWVKDRSLVARARGLLESLPPTFVHLFNAIFWDGQRFHRYVAGPSSLNGHHAGPSGNLRHSVEVAETCLSLAATEAQTCRSVLVLAALLHDAGKADEYAYDHPRRCFVMSARGALIGHKHTLLEWIAAARAEHRVCLTESHYLALLHSLTAAKGPDYLGLRPPVTLEATILSAADRVSGHTDLIAQTAPAADGFGKYHKHLGGRAFVVGEADLVALPPNRLQPTRMLPPHGP